MHIQRVIAGVLVLAKIAQLLRRYVLRIVLGLFLTFLFVFNDSGIADLKFTNQLEALLYDLRLNLSMKDSIDSRIVIVDIDEKSLAAEGRWPWGRDRLARLMDQLFDRYGAAIVGYDVIFAEKDESSGLGVLERLGREVLPRLTSEVRKGGLTIAAEAGTERLRDDRRVVGPELQREKCALQIVNQRTGLIQIRLA